MSDWWAEKLGGRASAAPPLPSAVPAAPRPGQPVQWQPQPPAATPPTGNQEVADPSTTSQGFALMNAGAQYTDLPTKAEHTKANSRCPGCNGENYFAATAVSDSGMPSRGPAPAARCLDCGYPLVQSGSPLGALTGQKPDSARPAPMAKSTAGFEGKIGELGNINPMTGEFTPRA